MDSDTSGYAPKYRRIAQALRREIDAGVLHPGQRLPPEPDLAQRFRVSLPTVRQALAVLRSEGLIESRHGIGSFVKETHRLQRPGWRHYGRARADQKLLTPHLRHEIVFAGVGQVPPHVADLFPEGTTEVVIRRRHLFDKETGRPEEIGASYIPMEYAAGTYLEDKAVVPQALFLCIEEVSGKRYARARDQLIARLGTADELSVLGLASGSPVVHVVHCAMAEDGTVLEVAESIWPAERTVIVNEYLIGTDSDSDVPGV
ncbi:GntR family transcriptional regulator [Nocardia farcinica]|uniref:GntR family transcriptional regulator n=1 Tax=Nocardia farcinica TaxID=37329 RepID=UPI0018936969|nr:GntR family transcriptional regulator [Nocardia farcinica]MBF6588306.1 GntR family transcriptional regulator [Nocardia farcinica]